MRDRVMLSKLKISGGVYIPYSKISVEKLIEKNGLKLEFVDVGQIGYWQNDHDTMVFRVKKASSAGDFGKFIHQMSPTEYNIILHHRKRIVRMWWDNVQ